MSTTKTFYWVDEFTDEVVPCEPKLEAWSKWMADPNHEPWLGREEGVAIADGREFDISPIELLGVITVTIRGGDVEFSSIPAGATEFVQMTSADGWDGETWSDTILDCLGGDVTTWWLDGDEIDVGCFKSHPTERYRFDANLALLSALEADPNTRGDL